MSETSRKIISVPPVALSSSNEAAVEEAIRRLAPELRRAYESAVDLVPGVVRSEIRVADFLRHENGHVERAALRLAYYWKYRQQVFGERYLLPLNQLGTGALNTVDVEFLRTGYYLLVPRPDGRGVVVLFNEGRLPPHGNPPGLSLTRCIFYLAHVHREHMHHITFLHVVTSGPRPGKEVNLDPLTWHIFRRAFPYRVHQILVVQAYEGPGKQELVAYHAYRSKLSAEYKSQRQCNGMIEANSVKGTLQALLARGLETACLPQCLGGTFDYDRDVIHWIRMRVSVEGAMQAAAPLQCYRASALPEINEFTCVSKRGALSRSSDAKVRSSLGQRKRQRRQTDNNQSTRPATTSGGTNDEAENDTNENDNNEENNETDDVTEQELARGRNALYARRSYQRRKLELLTLQDQCHMWTAFNDKVRQQNAALEAALAQAQQLVVQEYRHRE